MSVLIKRVPLNNMHSFQESGRIYSSCEKIKYSCVVSIQWFIYSLINFVTFLNSNLCYRLYTNLYIYRSAIPLAICSIERCDEIITHADMYYIIPRTKFHHFRFTFKHLQTLCPYSLFLLFTKTSSLILLSSIFLTKINTQYATLLSDVQTR